MEAYKANKLPINYSYSNNILNLLCDCIESYGEFKGYLRSMEYDYKFVLENLFINDLYYSFKIDGCKIPKEYMFHFSYLNKTNEVIEFNNLKKALYLTLEDISKNNFTLETINKINKLLFYCCSKNSKTKCSGKLRNIQNFILKPGIAGSSVSFIPPLHTELNSFMKNLVEYINSNDELKIIAVAITHYQFEKLHPYISGNGKIGRLLIPIQFSFYKKEPPLLFLSEIFENLKNTYFTQLGTENDESIEKFILFFLQCVIDQCNKNIKKIKKLNKIYKKDYEDFKTTIGGTTIYKVLPIMLRKVVFTTNDIVTEGKIHINSVNKVLNKLVDKGYLIKEKKKNTNRVTFCYKSIYDVYVN